MTKLDLRKELKAFYAPSAKKVEVVALPRFNLVMLDGEIEPGEPPAESSVFQAAVGALYAVSFTLKFMLKKRENNPVDYAVMPLEGLWWTDDVKFDFDRREPWSFTLMILQPKHVTATLFKLAVEQARAKQDNPALAKMRFETLREGTCIQTLHVGPYATEPETVARMHDFAVEHNYLYRGKHHEIYLGDPRRARPEKLKTILRQPVEKMR